MPYFQADPNADDYHRKLEEIRQFTEENYRRLSGMAEQTNELDAIFTPEDREWLRKVGIKL